LNAIVRVDPFTEQVESFPLPPDTPNVNLNTATFDAQGILWFTGQAGYYGSLDPSTGEITVHPAPEGRGPYGITTTPDGTVYYVSLANNYLARIDPESGEATVLDPPTVQQGARRVWSDSVGRLWISEWYAGQVGMYDPATGIWEEWKLPGSQPLAYAVFVDENDIVWLSDFGANALVRFDLQAEVFEPFPLTEIDANVRQLHGRAGEVWGAESRVDKLVVIRAEIP
jgi:virginiamycin B lyase